MIRINKQFYPFQDTFLVGVLGYLSYSGLFYDNAQRKSIYEEGELKAQKFNKPQKQLKSTLAQI